MSGKKKETLIWLSGLLSTNPRNLVNLLIEYKCKKWFNPRKWKCIKDLYYKFYSNPNVKTHEFWSKEDVEILKRYHNLPIKKIVGMLQCKRTLAAIYRARHRFKAKKRYRNIRSKYVKE